MRLRRSAVWAGSAACHAAGEPGGTHVAHSLRTAVHVPQRYVDAPGLEVSPRNVLKNLLVQAQFGHQPLELRVLPLLLQLFQPLRLVHLQTAIFFAPV